MDRKNIFSKLGFSPVKPDNLIMSKDNLGKIAKIFDDIFKESGTTEQIFITKTVEDEAFAISTAEDSSISASEIAHIKLTDEQSLRVLKYKNSDLPVEKKYEHLEYENIITVSRQNTGLGFKHLNLEIFCQLHHDLTLGLDEYTSKLNISKYHSGKFRQTDTVKVGKFPPYEPPKHIQIKSLLEELFDHYKSKTKVDFTDIIEFGVLLYAIHPFQNGNKRICRVIESALLDFYGYSAKKTISLGRAYSTNKTGFNYFLLGALNDRDTTCFVNFTIRGYLKEGETNMKELVKEEAEKKFKKRILPFLNEKKEKQYKRAFRLFEKYHFLRNNQFTSLMEEKGYSHSICQVILKTLQEEHVLIKISATRSYVFAGFKQFVNLKDFIDQHLES